jgi:hypothetical protein
MLQRCKNAGRQKQPLGNSLARRRPEICEVHVEPAWQNTHGSMIRPPKAIHVAGKCAEIEQKALRSSFSPFVTMRSGSSGNGFSSTRASGGVQLLGDTALACGCVQLIANSRRRRRWSLEGKNAAAPSEGAASRVHHRAFVLRRGWGLFRREWVGLKTWQRPSGDTGTAAAENAVSVPVQGDCMLLGGISLYALWRAGLRGVVVIRDFWSVCENGCQTGFSGQRHPKLSLTLPTIRGQIVLLAHHAHAVLICGLKLSANLVAMAEAFALPHRQGEARCRAVGGTQSCSTKGASDRCFPSYSRPSRSGRPRLCLRF